MKVIQAQTTTTQEHNKKLFQEGEGFRLLGLYPEQPLPQGYLPLYRQNNGEVTDFSIVKGDHIFYVVTKEGFQKFWKPNKKFSSTVLMAVESLLFGRVGKQQVILMQEVA